MTQLANAPTKKKYNHQCITMKCYKCDTEPCNKLEQEATLFAYYYLQKSNNTVFLTERVNNNPSEQQNKRNKIFRTLPRIRSLIFFLSDYGQYIQWDQFNKYNDPMKMITT